MRRWLQLECNAIIDGMRDNSSIYPELSWCVLYNASALNISVDSSAPGRCGCIIFKFIFWIDILGNSCEITPKWVNPCLHYSDVIVSAIASQSTSLMIVYSKSYSGAGQTKHQSSAWLAFVMGNSPMAGIFPLQRASNAENVFIWWSHHDVVSSNGLVPSGNKPLPLASETSIHIIIRYHKATMS